MSRPVATELPTAMLVQAVQKREIAVHMTDLWRWQNASSSANLVDGASDGRASDRPLARVQLGSRRLGKEKIEKGRETTPALMGCFAASASFLACKILCQMYIKSCRAAES